MGSTLMLLEVTHFSKENRHLRACRCPTIIKWRTERAHDSLQQVQPRYQRRGVRALASSDRPGGPLTPVAVPGGCLAAGLIEDDDDEADIDL